MSDHDLLTPAELKGALKISTTTYYRLLAAGALPYRSLGTQKRFVLAEVVAAMPKGPRASRVLPQRPQPIDMVAILKDRAKHWGQIPRRTTS